MLHGVSDVCGEFSCKSKIPNFNIKFSKTEGYDYYGKYVRTVPPYLKNSVSCVLFVASCRPKHVRVSKEYDTVLRAMYIYFILPFILMHQYCINIE
jgi:hypothetical protein